METLVIPRTQTEMLELMPKHQRLFIGVPKETTLQENRVALVPHSVMTLTAQGHRVVVEAGAGDKAKFSDHDYSEAGAEVASSPEEVFKADVLLKVAPPTLPEIDLMRPNQVLISPIHLPLISAEYITRLQKKRVIALAMEYIRDDDTGMFPVVHIMSEIAGINAILIAADLLNNTRGGKGVLLGGIAGVPPAKVIILGAGVVAEFATRTALGLGAEVRIFDNNVYKLMRLQNRVGRQLHTSVINPRHLNEQLVTADVAIGAMHSAQGRTPLIVGEDIICKMQPGSVIVDVSIDQGGCFETSKATTHENPTYVVDGVVHYCVANMPGAVPRTSTVALNNATLPFVIALANQGYKEAMRRNHHLLNGLNVCHGKITYQAVAEALQQPYTPAEQVIGG